MVKVYLHIGTHKTGTTSIQRFLTSNRDKLLDLGYLYPLSGKPKALSIAQHKLSWGVMQKKRFRRVTGKWEDLGQEWGNLHEEIAREKKENVIISAEDFSNLNAKTINALKKHLSRYDTKIVIYLRRQDEFFLSLYATVLKGGFYKPIEEYIRLKRHRGDYYTFLGIWSKAFGKENLLIRTYEKSEIKQGLIFNFLETIGLSDYAQDLEEFKRIANIRPNEKTLKLLRRLNWLTRKKMFLPQHKCRQLYIKRLIHPKSQKFIAKVPDFIIGKEILSVEARVAFLAEFEEINSKVAIEYLGRQDGKLFYNS